MLRLTQLGGFGFGNKGDDVPPANVALDANGGVASASSTFSAAFSADRTNDGYRHTNNNWGTGGSPGGGWSSTNNPTSGAPEWLEIAFDQVYTITQVDVFTLADAANYTTDPTLADTFSSYGIQDFKTQYWNGSAWTDVDTVAGNDKVWRQFSWPSISTDAIRIRVTAALANSARIVEVEAWGV